MKRFLPVMAVVAILLWLPAGASAYTITFGSIDASWTLNARAGDASVDSGDITNQPLGAGQYFNARGLATVTSSDDLNTATSDWSVIVTNPTQGLDVGTGGTDTYFNTYVKINQLLLDLQDGVTGQVGYSTAAIPSFMATQEGPGTSNPIIRIDVTWGGDDFYSVGSASVYLAGGQFPFNVKWVIPQYAVGASTATNTQEADADGINTFLNNPSDYWYLKLFISRDSGNTTGSDPGLEMDENAWVCATVHLIEPDLPYSHIPVPPSMLLLGSGLLTLALARHRRRG
jgi:hypothetical protein